MPSSVGEMTAIANGAGVTGPGPGFIPHHPNQQHPQGLSYPPPPLINKCAGCDEIGTEPLLACDDLDGVTKDGIPAIGDPSLRQR